MAYEVIARKWRPKSFDDLVGQRHISQTLFNALKSQRLPHALLFTGPRGTGKTSTARILAKILRCPHVKEILPCNECSECQEISTSRSVNVIEVDGASNNGVDAIRELRDTVGYMPSTGTYKIYIIDEVHMLSTSAFNALLKTLEEPPSHVVFVLATTEVHKIPNTILSRCQRFDFRRIPLRQISERLKSICEKENVQAEDQALWLIARQADGSMRDSQSLLDQIITFSEGNITLQQVIDVLGLTDRALLTETLEALVNRNSSQVIDVVERLFKAGYDPKLFLHDLLEEVRHLLMVKMVPDNPSSVVDLVESEIEKLKELATNLSEEDLHMLFDMVLKGANDLARAPEPRVVLEMILLRAAAAPRIENLLDWQGKAPAEKPKAQKTKNISSTVAPPSPAGSGSEKWAQFVSRLKKVNTMMSAKLEHTFLMEQNGNTLIVGVPGKMKFLLDQINDKNFQRKLGNYLKTFWGPDLKVEVKLADNTGQTPKAMETQKKEEKEREVRSQVENHPMVKSTKDIFKTELQSIKENQK